MKTLINYLLIVPLFCLFITSGCSNREDVQPVQPAPSSEGATSLNLGESPAVPDGGQSGPAVGNLGNVGDISGNDPVAEAKDMEKQRKELEARIKAGEEGTTPDPVEDRWIGLLEKAYNSYYSEYNKDPGSLQDLVKAGYLRSVPNPPPGKKYAIIPDGGGIQIVEAR